MDNSSKEWKCSKVESQIQPPQKHCPYSSIQSQLCVKPNSDQIYNGWNNYSPVHDIFQMDVILHSFHSQKLRDLTKNEINQLANCDNVPKDEVFILIIQIFCILVWFQFTLNEKCENAQANQIYDKIQNIVLSYRHPFGIQECLKQGMF